MPNKLVARLCLMFGTPDTPNPEAWFAEMDRLVQSYSETELNRAADVVLRTYRGKAFPSVAVMLSACEDARQELAPKRPLNTDEAYRSWSAARIEQANALIRCAMGRKAAEEGWIFALHSFVRENERLPGQHELGQVKLIAKRFDEAYQDCLEGRGGVFGAALQRLGASMLARRAELARIANGGA